MLVWFPTILDRAMLDLVVGVETNAEMKTFVNLLYGSKEIVIPITKIAYNQVKMSNFCFASYYEKNLKAFILWLNFFKIIFHVVASGCAIYGGVPHPSNNNVCCDMACGSFCGKWNCDKGPGGSSACCKGSITASGKKCSSSVAAPCEIGDMFYMQL